MKWKWNKLKRRTTLPHLIRKTKIPKGDSQPLWKSGCKKMDGTKKEIKEIKQK